MQTVTALQEINPSEKIFCINPQVVSIEEVRKTVVDWLHGQEARLGEDAYILATAALSNGYPCNPWFDI